MCKCFQKKNLHCFVKLSYEFDMFMRKSEKKLEKTIDFCYFISYICIVFNKLNRGATRKRATKMENEIEIKYTRYTVYCNGHEIGDYDSLAEAEEAYERAYSDEDETEVELFEEFFDEDGDEIDCRLIKRRQEHVNDSSNELLERLEEHYGCIKYGRIKRDGVDVYVRFADHTANPANSYRFGNELDLSVVVANVDKTRSKYYYSDIRELHYRGYDDFDKCVKEIDEALDEIVREKKEAAMEEEEED